MPATTTRADSSSAVSQEWQELLRLIPGYDPFCQAEGCRFDEEAAQLVLDFFPECLRHIEGELAGQPFVLEPWEKAFLANLFGWKMLDEYEREVRRYREAFLFLPRKSGKTPLAAGIGCAVLFCDEEIGQQNYIAAGDREQAGKLFRHCKGMVLQEPELARRCRIYGGKAEAGQSRSIVIEAENSFLRVIAAEGDKEHGGNTHLAMVDELHVQPDGNLLGVLETSMSSKNRRNPLLITISTAGHDRKSVCWQKYRKACRVRDNGGDKSKPGYDPRFLPVIYETRPEEDWTDPKVWAKANPNLNVSVSMDYLRRACKEAQEIPEKENTFRQLHLNQWTQQATRWLSMHVWSKQKRLIDPDMFLGRECWGGLDLASTEDITAFVLLFREPDGGYSVLPYFWVPRAKLDRRVLEKVPYDLWERQGFLRVTEGDWCDYVVVEHDIKQLAQQYGIKKVGYDPREASMLAQKLIDAGLVLERLIQSPANYNEPCKVFEELVGQQKIYHGAHPILAWHAENVALYRTPGTELRMPSKGNSADKIDGICAALMALAMAMLDNTGQASLEWI